MPIEIGTPATATTALRPQGRVRIDNHVYDAKSQQGMVETGTQVMVVGSTTQFLIVIPTEQWQEDQHPVGQATDILTPSEGAADWGSVALADREEMASRRRSMVFGCVVGLIAGWMLPSMAKETAEVSALVGLMAGLIYGLLVGVFSFHAGKRVSPIWKLASPLLGSVGFCAISVKCMATYSVIVSLLLGLSGAIVALVILIFLSLILSRV